MGDQVNMSTLGSSAQVLTAVRLGWLTVEVFCRLRRYTRSGHKPKERQEKHRGDANWRFGFSDRSLSEHDALLLAVDQLRHTAAKLDAKLPPLPFPPNDELDRSLEASDLDLDALQGRLDNWSTHVWAILSTEDEVAGRGFTYGGNLSDTYWQTDVPGPDKFTDLLSSQRLEYLAVRFEGIASYLPLYVTHVLHHTLYQWRDAQERIKNLDPDSKKQALRQLESQAKVWRDLLFGGRSAESYLTVSDRRFITWGAAGATAVLVLAAMILVWLSVLALSGAGRTVTASMTGLPQKLPEAQAAFASDLLDWQKWSALLATLSSVVVFITGLVTRISGWVISFHNLVREWLKLRLIHRRTYRHWRV